MQALILAAGQSRRFQPLGDKNFFKLGGKFLIERQVEVLKQAGVKSLVFVCNKENSGRIKKTFPRAEVLEQKNLEEGMRGAVLTAEKLLDKPTLIISSNDVVEARAVKKVLSSKGGDGAILAQKVKSYFPGGYLKTGKGKIFSIVEKPVPGKEPSDLVNIVCHFFNDPSVLIAELKKASNANDDGYEKALTQVFKKQRFSAVENIGTWQSLKYPWHALDLTQSFLKGLKRKISKKADVAKTAVINGEVVIEDGVKIFDYAVIQGPAYLGRNAAIGTNAFVRDSFVGANSVVGSSSELARSYLGENVWLHRNYVGDSVIADNVGLGAGAVCANLRLDEEEVRTVVGEEKIGTGRSKFGSAIGKNCRIGVSTSIMPGVLIGENSFVGSGMLMEKNLKSGVFLKAETRLKEVENAKIVNARGKIKI
ncbi:MAG: sugar phosphate nucleotidyltransferase [Patescibacteria group bacterium]